MDDAWIKRKYVSALMPFEPTDLKSLQGRHNYHLMSSNEVMQEMAAFKVAAKNAEDARARVIGMHKGTSLALKAKIVELVCKKKRENCPPTSHIIFSLTPLTFNLAATLGGHANNHKDHMRRG